jgi:hypothetical protein
MRDCSRSCRSSGWVRWVLPLVLGSSCTASSAAPSDKDPGVDEPVSVVHQPRPIDLGFRAALPSLSLDARIETGLAREGPPFEPGISKLIAIPPISVSVLTEAHRDPWRASSWNPRPSPRSPSDLIGRMTLVPEPTSLFLLVTGLLTGLVGLAARRALARSESLSPPGHRAS